MEGAELISMQDQVPSGGQGGAAGSREANGHEAALGGEVVHHGLSGSPGQEALVPQTGLETKDRSRQAGELVEGAELELLAEAGPLKGRQAALGPTDQDARLPQGCPEGVHGLAEVGGGEEVAGFHLDHEELASLGAQGEGAPIGGPERSVDLRPGREGKGLPALGRPHFEGSLQPGDARSYFGRQAQAGRGAQTTTLEEACVQDTAGGGLRKNPALPLGIKLPAGRIVFARGLGPGQAGQPDAAVSPGHQGLAPGVGGGQGAPGKVRSPLRGGQGASLRKANGPHTRFLRDQDGGLTGLIEPEATHGPSLKGGSRAHRGRQEEGGRFFQDKEQHGQDGPDHEQAPAGDGEGHEPVHSLGAGLNVGAAGHGVPVQRAGRRGAKR